MTKACYHPTLTSPWHYGAGTWVDWGPTLPNRNPTALIDFFFLARLAYG